MVIELFPECSLESESDRIVWEEGIMDDMSIYDDLADMFLTKDDKSIFNDPPCIGQELGVSVDEMGISEPPQSGMLDLQEFGIDEPPCDDDNAKGASSELQVNLLSASDYSNDIIMVEELSLDLDECLSLQQEQESAGVHSEKQGGLTEETSMDGLTLPDCLDPEPVQTHGTQRRTTFKAPNPKMMELVEYILHLEGIKDIRVASAMTDAIMEEIVENSIAASDASGSTGAYSPSSGERLHCSDTPCGQDANYSREHRSIKSVVSKAKDPSPKSTYLPPCRVCGDNASGFHYGANTCEACKGFFRRSIVKIQQKKESYKCFGKGDGCVLGPGKRNPCAACRYARCLEAGMSISAIKTGRYTYEKRTKDTVEVRNMQTVDKPLRQETYISDSEVDQIIQSLKDILLKTCPGAYNIFDRETNLTRQWKIYNDHKAKLEIFGTMSVIPKEVWEEFYKETGIDLDNRQELMREMACRMEYGLSVMVDFVRAIPGFADLSVSDQTELIKASHFEFFFLMHHKAFNPELRVVSGMLAMHQSEMEKLAEKDMVDQLFQFSTSLKNLELSFDEIVLLRGISVTFTDRCQLEDPKAVERIQWKLLNALRVLAKRQNFKPEQRLWHILDRLTALRTMTEISKELDKQKCSWPVMKEHPLVLDILQN